MPSPRIPWRRSTHASVFTDAGTTPVKLALAAVVAATTTTMGVVLDVGSGLGTYLAHANALDATDGRPVAAPSADNNARLGVALDLPAVAIRRATRVHARAGAVVGDVTEGLPVVDGAAAVLLDVFASHNQTEYAVSCTPTGCSWR